MPSDRAAHQILYRSAATAPFDTEALERLVIQSRQRNQRLGVGGMLIYSNGMIAQILEGEERTVRALYKKIAKDERHHAVTCLVDRPVETREFEDWSMGLEEISGELPDGLTNVAKPLTPDNVSQFNTLGGFQLLRSVDRLYNQRNAKAASG